MMQNRPHRGQIIVIEPKWSREWSSWGPPHRPSPRGWSYSSVKKLFHTGDDWQSTELRSARAPPTSVALLNLLKDFWTDHGDGIPTMPNRHACSTYGPPRPVQPGQRHQVPDARECDELVQCQTSLSVLDAGERGLAD